MLCTSRLCGASTFGALVPLEVGGRPHCTAVVFGRDIHQCTAGEQLRHRLAHVVHHRGVQGARTTFIHDVHRHAPAAAAESISSVRSGAAASHQYLGHAR